MTRHTRKKSLGLPSNFKNCIKNLNIFDSKAVLNCPCSSITDTNQNYRKIRKYVLIYKNINNVCFDQVLHNKNMLYA